MILSIRGAAGTILGLLLLGSAAVPIISFAAETPASNSSEVALPTLLSAADASRYTDIFALQAKRKWRDADREIASLTDRLLMTDVLAQRYLSPGYRASYTELRDWLVKYGDAPDASRIHTMAMKRRPKGEPEPPAAIVGAGGASADALDRHRRRSSLCQWRTVGRLASRAYGVASRPCRQGAQAFRSRGAFGQVVMGDIGRGLLGGASRTARRPSRTVQLLARHRRQEPAYLLRPTCAADAWRRFLYRIRSTRLRRARGADHDRHARRSPCAGANPDRRHRPGGSRIARPGAARLVRGAARHRHTRRSGQYGLAVG